jgi:hypothetical protein
MKSKRRKNIVSRIKKGSLIKYALDDIKRESFDVIKRELQGTLKKRFGVYALYKRDKLVRVGLGTNIFNRLKGHSKNVRLDWDTASLFILKNIKYLRDLETAIVRIAKPKYNDQKGRVEDEHYLERLLRKTVKKKQKLLQKSKREKDKELRQLTRDVEKIRDALS